MIKATHLNLASRKALLARLLGYEALEIHAPERDRAANKVTGEMLESAEREIDAKPQVGGIKPPPQLDQWLHFTVAQARKLTEGRFGPQAGTPADAMLQYLKQRADQISCLECVNGKRICRGTNRDDLIVATSGHCIRHVTRIFDAAKNITLAYYRHYARDSVDLTNITLCTSKTAGKPHDVPIPVYIGAETIYEDNAGPSSVVDFQIAINQLDWKSWLAALFIFLHELVCHAAAGTGSSFRGRRGLYAQDPFAEGWMSHICGMILEDLRNGAPPAISATGLLSFRNEQVDEGEKFRLHQESELRDNGEKVPSVPQSVTASYAVFEALQRLTSSPQEAREMMYRLSLELNLLDRPVTMRAALVTEVARARQPESSRYGILNRVIKQYVTGQSDAAGLMVELLRA